MVRPHVRLAGEIGDGACHFEHAVVPPRGQTEPSNGLREERGARRVRGAVRVDFPGLEPRVGPPLPVHLPFARPGDSAAYRRGGLAALGPGEVLGRDGRHFELDVDAVEQRTRDAASIALDLVGGAPAAARIVAEVAAGAGTRCLFAIDSRQT